jgi:hypothetical protein
MIEHNYSEAFSNDETNHWLACLVCGEKKDIAAHTGGTATCAKQAECSVCKAAYGELDATKHSNETVLLDKDPTCT